MKADKQKSLTFELCSFRHSSEVRDFLIEITQVDNIEFAPLMRQLINEGLKSTRNVQVVGNRIADRGTVKHLNKVSRAS